MLESIAPFSHLDRLTFHHLVGKDNEECLCETCEHGKRGGFAVKVEAAAGSSTVTATVSVPRSGPPTRYVQDLNPNNENDEDTEDEEAAQGDTVRFIRNLPAESAISP